MGVKLAVVGSTLILSAANHVRLVPMAANGRAGALPALRLNIALEQIALLSVIIITEILVRQNPGG